MDHNTQAIVRGAQAVVSTTAQFPDKLAPLFQPKRYKVLHGGRGGAKSWGVARALLLMAVQKCLRVLCVREFQDSIKDSVHKLLSDQIEALGLRHHYHIEQARIYCLTTGSEFSFEGIRHNATKIKSYEGVDICWAEEANKITKSSWEVLTPTIRKDGSEIWVTFNPELETDETYIRFIKNPPPDSVVIEINWRDNPWFPDTLRKEKDHLQATDPDAYLNIYEGKCRVMLDGAVYAVQIRDAMLESRITKVPYDNTVPVDVWFDLGRRDLLTMWFTQYVAMEYRVLRFYSNSGQHISYYVKKMQDLPYIYGTIGLPHDGRAKTIGTKKSVEEQIRAYGYKVRIVPKLSIADGINAARTIFPQCYFDEKLCSDGLQHLRHYKYEVNETTLSREPVHDINSHAADGFRTFAVGVKMPKKESQEGMAQRAKTLGLQMLGKKPSRTGWMR